MKAIDFINKAKDIANNYKTLYIMGCFGAPMTDKNKSRYTKNNSYNKQAARTKMINNASADTFGFDCVCLVKGILWGWDGSTNKQYGGAAYASNGVPDFGTEGMKNYCTSWSKDFSNIVPGEVLWLSGHAGIYIGDGLAVECTPSWANKVQITAVKNIGTKAGYNARTWTAHGKLKFVTDYEAAPQPVPQPTEWPKYHKVTSSDSLSSIAKMYYGNGDKAHYMFIANANNLKNPNVIITGSTLVIPQYGATPTPAPQPTPTIVNPVSRNAAVDQLEVKATDLNVRQGAGTGNKSLGFAKKGYYNYYETAQANGYTWYRIGDNQWVAYKSSWITLLPVQTEYWIPDTYRLLVAKTLRTSCAVIAANRVKVGSCVSATKALLTSTKSSDIAKVKVGANVKINKIIKKNGLVWGAYGNCYIVLCNADGTKQAVRV